MNANSNELFPDFKLFENAFKDIFTNNKTIDYIEEESFIPLNQIELLPSDSSFMNKVFEFKIDESFLPTKERKGKKIVFNVTTVDKRKRRYNISNLPRKIKSHFIRFLIDFCNDALEEENIKIVNYLNFNNFVLPNIYIIWNRNFNFKEKTIRDILKLDTSYKYGIFGIDINRKLLEEIELLTPRLTNLFQMNSLKLFKYYYNKEKPLNKISFENKEIFLSPRAKTFYDLLEKNKDTREEIIEVTKKYFLFEESDL